MEKPSIDITKCTGCGACVEACLRHGLEIHNNVVTYVRTDDCTWCGDCEAVCPNNAITCPYEIVSDN